MKSVVIGILVVFAAPIPASAGTLSISGENINWDPLSQPSPEFVLGLEDTDSAGLLRIWAWQLMVKITPEAGATGTVGFSSVTSPQDYIPPSYVFGSNSDGISVPLASPPPDTLGTLTDSIYPGVDVPASGDNLIQFPLSASSDASGKFDIVIVSDPNTGAAWYPDGSVTPMPFDGMPFGSSIPVGSVIIGSVPEPSTISQLLAGVLIPTMLLWRRRKGKQSR
jgi:hypothetical protein